MIIFAFEILILVLAAWTVVPCVRRKRMTQGLIEWCVFAAAVIVLLPPVSAVCTLIMRRRLEITAEVSETELFKGNNTIRDKIAIAINYTDIQMSAIIFKKVVFKRN